MRPAVFAFVVGLLSLASVGVVLASGKTLDEGCTFDRGARTCTTVTVTEEHRTHQEFSGCLYGPASIPSSRVRAFDDTVQVTNTTTELGHGMNGSVFSTITTTSTQLLASHLVSDICQPPA